MHAVEKALGLVVKAAGIVGGIALLGIMLTTVVDVTLRSTLNIAFLGVTEVTELGLVVVAAFGIAYCGWTEGHIALEFGERFVPRSVWQVAQVVIRLASAAIIAAVAVYSFSEALAVYERRAHTNLLQVVQYPFYLIVAAGFLAYALILLLRATEAWRVGPERGGAA